MKDYIMFFYSNINWKKCNYELLTKCWKTMPNSFLFFSLLITVSYKNLNKNFSQSKYFLEPTFRHFKNAN